MSLRYFSRIKDEFFAIKWINLREVFSASILVFLIIMFFSIIFLAFDLLSLRVIKDLFDFK